MQATEAEARRWVACCCGGVGREVGEIVRQRVGRALLDYYWYNIVSGRQLASNLLGWARRACSLLSEDEEDDQSSY